MAKKGWQEDVKVSAQKIWLAGLGALAVAEEEGSKLFKNLVREGEKYGDAGRETVNRGYTGARRGLDEATGKAKKAAEETWSKVEGGLDERLAKTLHRIGVPTRDEIAALSRRVEELTGALERMRQKETAKATPAPGAAAARSRAMAGKPPATAAKPVRPASVVKATAPQAAATPAPPPAAARPAPPRAAARPAAPAAAARPTAAAKPATAEKSPPAGRAPGGRAASPQAAGSPGPAPSVPEKITTPRDVTTTADVKTSPR